MNFSITWSPANTIGNSKRQYFWSCLAESTANVQFKIEVFCFGFALFHFCCYSQGVKIIDFCGKIVELYRTENTFRSGVKCCSGTTATTLLTVLCLIATNGWKHNTRNRTKSKKTKEKTKTKRKLGKQINRKQTNNKRFMLLERSNMPNRHLSTAVTLLSRTISICTKRLISVVGVCLIVVIVVRFY